MSSRVISEPAVSAFGLARDRRRLAIDLAAEEAQDEERADDRQAEQQPEAAVARNAERVEAA